MKVQIYKLPDGQLDVLVLASPGKGLAPVLVKNVTLETVKDSVRPIIDKMRRGGTEQEPLPV